METVTLLSLLLIWPAPQTPPPQTTQPVDPEELVWNVVQSLQSLPAPTSQPFAQQFDHIRGRREQLLEATALYGRLHPGGKHIDAVVRIQLQALFELGSIDGQYDRLYRQVDDYLRNPPSPAALHEAAYWSILCRRLRRLAHEPPTGPALPAVDRALIDEYQAYVRQYPDSRHVPRLAQGLAEEALRRGDLATVDNLSTLLNQHFARHAVTRWLAGVLHRQRAIGQPVAFELRTPAGNTIRTSDWRGKPGVVVAWAGFDARSLARVREVTALGAARQELSLVGVNFDDSQEAMRCACDAAGVNWPQQHEPHGLAGEFAERWGIRELPVVFVIDRQGRLLGATGEDDWRILVEQALRP